MIAFMPEPRLERLEWDSLFFGFPIGRVVGDTFDGFDDARRTTAEASVRGFRCVYFLAAGSDGASWTAATHSGFVPIDIRVELQKSANDSGQPCEVATKEDEPALLDLVDEHVFTDSRFFRDPNFGRDKAREMFEIRARRGTRERDWFTACERVDGRIAGFVTARMRDEANGAIELVAVGEAFRGRGVGRRIVEAASAELVRRGARQVSVVTQGANLGAQRLYADCGFRLSRCGLWFHLWL